MNIVCSFIIILHLLSTFTFQSCYQKLFRNSLPVMITLTSLILFLWFCICFTLCQIFLHQVMRIKLFEFIYHIVHISRFTQQCFFTQVFRRQRFVLIINVDDFKIHILFQMFFHTEEFQYQLLVLIIKPQNITKNSKFSQISNQLTLKRQIKANKFEQFQGCFKRKKVAYAYQNQIQHYYLKMMLRKIQAFIARKLQNTKSTQPILKLFLTGIKGQLGRVHYPKPYNFYISLGSIILTLFVGKCVIKYRQHEIKNKGNNWLIPDFIYDVRQESYIYWEVVRRAKGVPTTFTFYKWDGDSLMYQIDRKGQQTPLHTHRAIEDTRTFLSPFHEYLFPASAQVHSNILLYVKNINNPYCLFNYLRLKPVNIGDWLRAGYFSIYRDLGLTNRWRYDQFVRKPDIYYRWQKVKLAYFLSKDRQKLYQTIQKANIKLEDILTFLFWFL